LTATTFFMQDFIISDVKKFFGSPFLSTVIFR